MGESQRSLMLRGKLYDPSDPELVAGRVRARRLWQKYNATDPEDQAARAELLAGLLASIGDHSAIEPPFFCDYGTQIELGSQVFVNKNCVFLDPAPIRIGDQAQIGPGVQLLTASHPRDPRARAEGPEFALPITIGARVWLGGGVIVCPGVTIGEGTTIGAGSVVTRNMPAGVIAAGNPCAVMREVRSRE